MFKIPKTLFARTALTISLLLLVFVILSSSVIFYYVMTPMTRQSASHLAALITISAQTWVELPPETRHDFEMELKEQHGISLVSHKQNFHPNSINTPFFHFFNKEIQSRLGKQTEVLEEFKPDFWIWVKVPIASHLLYVGFPHSVIGPNPSVALFLLIVSGALLVIFSSLFLVNYMINPLNQLLAATKKIGQGRTFPPLKEKGPEELILLTRSFNTMNTQVQELLQNRTILLAGISHDLRTPIARIHLALEMLDKQQDESLIQGINNDLIEMNTLIKSTLEFSKGMDTQSSKQKQIEMSLFLRKYIQRHPKSSQIKYISEESTANHHCKLFIPPNVLERVLNNLLENAFHYSFNQPVEIKSRYEQGINYIHLKDKGSGIPEDKLNRVFQPFYRLESSRNVQTGGTGLGLAIVQQLCKKYGWEIQLKSKENQGTEAILTIRNSIE